MTTRNKVVIDNTLTLAKYSTGEHRIEDVGARQCSDWLHHTDVDAIKANPATMQDYNSENDLDECDLID